jgi:hypothetical protein
MPASNSSTRTVVVPVYAFESPKKANQGNDQIRRMAVSDPKNPQAAK